MNWKPTALEQQRLDTLRELTDQGIDPYPAGAQRTHTCVSAHELFLQTEEEEQGQGEKIWLCGRVVSLRDMGKTVFAHIEDESGRIQLFVRQNTVGEESHKLFRSTVDIGDIVQAAGQLFRTRMGEVSLNVSEWSYLSKSLSPLPMAKEQEVDGELVRYAAFSDTEERFRLRYADLAVNPTVREVFRARSRMIASLRRFLDQHGFLEVETPIMQPIYGGAAARPFLTRHNQLKQDLYLRVSFELYLKRLLVGGIERVYEIGRDFRNEGVDATHNPEFTQLEFYASYWDYKDLMTFVELLIRNTATDVLGSRQVHFRGELIDLDGEWKRMTVREAIRQFGEFDYAALDNREQLVAAIRKAGGKPNPDASWGKLIDDSIAMFVERHLVQPTFLTEYPVDISPLAKGVPGDERHVQRFELFIGGMEIGNAFTELTDPLEQERRFTEIRKMHAVGSDEIHPIDQDYLRAMRYGMPPNGGFGAGVDRLAMLFTDSASIREVLLFPHLREREDDGSAG